ncbi:MAG: hypothetical protein H6685_04695 [Deltaproteobacteria bacterium]|nr:hypothetical protein [Deltaproteobacteria bacterium]
MKFVGIFLLASALVVATWTACTGDHDDDHDATDDDASDDDLECPLPELEGLEGKLFPIEGGLSPSDIQAAAVDCAPYEFDAPLATCPSWVSPGSTLDISLIAATNDRKGGGFGMLWHEYYFDEGEKSKLDEPEFAWYFRIFDENGEGSTPSVDVTESLGLGYYSSSGAAHLDDKLRLVTARSTDNYALNYFVLDRESGDLVKSPQALPNAMYASRPSIFRWRDGFLLAWDNVIDEEAEISTTEARFAIADSNDDVQSSGWSFPQYPNPVDVHVAGDLIALAFRPAIDEGKVSPLVAQELALYLVILDENFEAVAGPIMVSEQSSGDVKEAKVVEAEDGGWFVAYIYRAPENPLGGLVYISRFNRELHQIRGPELVHTNDNGQRGDLQLIHRDDGGTQVFWAESQDEEGGYCDSIRSRIYNVPGCPDGPTIRANEEGTEGFRIRIQSLGLPGGRSALLTKPGPRIGIQYLDKYGRPECPG